MRRLNDMDGYSEAEITAARAAACYMATIETPDEDGLADAPTVEGEQPQFELEPGAVPRLAPGEKLNFVAPNRPNSNMDPFMRLMLREVAAGVGPSYESLSRDYSQSNYSSSRLALLDDRDLWRVFQQFFIRSFREPLHREWLQQAVLARAIPSIAVSDYAAQKDKFEAVSFKPRGWSWVDPTKEVEAYIKARRAGFMSTSQIIALTGGGVDRGDVWEEISQENQDAADEGLVLTTDPAQILERSETVVAAEPPADPAAAAAAANPSATQEPSDSGYNSKPNVTDALALALARGDFATKPSVVNNQISPQPVVVNTPDVNVDIAPAQINLQLPERAEIDQAEIVERDANGLAKVVRTNRGEFDIEERDADGNARVYKRRKTA